MTKAEEIMKLPKINEDEFRRLWYFNFWDGIYSGMLLYKDNKYWFTCFDDAENYVVYKKDGQGLEDLGWWRRYVIKELTNEQIEQAEYWHNLFYKNVAVYTTYDDNGDLEGDDFPLYTGLGGIPLNHGSRPPQLRHVFYDKLREEFPHGMTEEIFSNGKIIGWFEV